MGCVQHYYNLHLHVTAWRATSGRRTPRRTADGRTPQRAADRRTRGGGAMLRIGIHAHAMGEGGTRMEPQRGGRERCINIQNGNRRLRRRPFQNSNRRLRLRPFQNSNRRLRRRPFQNSNRRLRRRPFQNSNRRLRRRLRRHDYDGARFKIATGG